MRRSAGCLVAALVVGCRSNAPAPKEDDRMLLVVSIDALARGYIDDPAHPLPNIGRLAREGAVAKSLTSVFPSSTYPAHTTMVTGVAPAKHGIYSNTVFDPYGKNESGWYWYASDIRVPTLWDAARAANMTVANVTWPVTVGAPFTWSFPQVWRARIDEDDKLLAALSTPGLAGELSAQKKNLPADHRPDRARVDAALVVLAKKPRLAFVYLTDLDTVQHDVGPRTDEMWRTLDTTDALVGEIVAAAKRAAPKLTVVLVSDHGMLPVTRDVRPNVALLRAGMLDVKDKKIVRYDAAAWRSGGSAAIMGAPQQHDKVRALFTDLARDPANGIARVIDREEITRLGGYPDALVVLQAADDAEFREDVEEPLVVPSQHKGAHGWAPAGRPALAATLILWGDGVKAGVALGDAAMIDVAPTIAALAGISLPTADGHSLVPR